MSYSEILPSAPVIATVSNLAVVLVVAEGVQILRASAAVRAFLSAETRAQKTPSRAEVFGTAGFHGGRDEIAPAVCQCCRGNLSSESSAEA
jgi:hypothetical protein